MMQRFIETKFNLPSLRAGGISRPRLSDRLQAGLQHGRKLTLISAPAGYGKTTLASEWLAEVQPATRVVWLSLDESDNAPARFLAYLLAALERVPGGGWENLRAVLENTVLPPLDILAASLIEDINAAGEQMRGPEDNQGKRQPALLLALDDYHKIQNRLIHDLAQVLVERMPACLHMVLLTREDPPLTLPKFRARGEMTEIRAEDLRFTSEEAAQFFRQVMHLNLQPEWVAALETRTEGWIASLQLVGLSLQNRDPSQTEAFIQTFSGSHRYVFDYLAEEVIVQQGEEIRQFLAQTAMLERFNAGVCDAVRGRGDSQALLTRLEQANLFLVPLDEERVWYRYHHLFADYLRSGLSAAERRHALGRAAEWHEEQGLTFEAVRYGLASGDHGLAADIIERAIQQASTWSGGDVATLVSWLDALPRAVLRDHPLLSLHASRALYLSGRLDQSEQFIQQAEEWLRENPQADAEIERLLATGGVYRGAIAALRGQLADGLQLTSNALERIAGGDLLARARGTYTLGMIHEQTGDLAQAGRLYLQSGELAERAGVAYLAINARCGAAQMLISEGRLSQAAEICREVLEQGGEATIPPLGLARAILGRIAFERNDLDEAERQILEGIQLTQRGGITEDLPTQLMFLTSLKQAMGDPAGARAAFEQADAILRAFRVPRLALMSAAYRTRLDLAQGQVEAAQQWARQYQEFRQAETVEFLLEAEDLVLARVLLASGQAGQAAGVLEEIFRQAEAAGRMRTAIEAMVVLALALRMLGKNQSAQELLARAVRLAEPEGLARVFLDEGPALAGMLSEARSAAPGFVARLLAVRNRAGKEADAAEAPEGLSEQELRVLRLVCAGQSNQEIAAELVISPGTAKWHVHNILQKLGVSNRAQAIVRARELGIEG